MPSVLVTGASRGIGKSIVEHLAARGWDVIAGVRSQQDADAVTKLDPQRVSSVLLDVTSADDIAGLEAALPDRLDAVVNNAGVAVGGAMETLSPDEWRKQLEINVIGQLAVTQAVLPRLRRSRGRIVFISSVNGRLSMPLVGAYSASKFALEAAADALRMELSPWKIRVIVVEPAQTDTDMWRTADNMVAELEAGLTPEHRTLYAKHIAGFKKMIPMSQTDRRTRAEGVRSRRGGAHRSSTARPLRRRDRPQGNGGRDAGPADEAPRFCAAAGVRPAVGCRRSSSATAARPQDSSPVKPQGCNGFRPLTAVCRAPRCSVTTTPASRWSNWTPSGPIAPPRMSSAAGWLAPTTRAPTRSVPRPPDGPVRASSGHCTSHFRCR